MKKALVILLALMMIVSVCLVSCKDEDDKTQNPDNTPTQDQSPENPDNPKPGEDKPGNNDGGGLQVGEDDDDGKWGDFIPYN